MTLDMIKKLGLIAAVMLASASQAAEYVRWTGSDDQDASFDHVLTVLSTKLGVPFTKDQFRLNEKRDLAYTKFQHYPQVHAGLDVAGTALRIWTDRQTGKLLQVEAHVEKPAVVQNNAQTFASLQSRMSFAEEQTFSSSDAVRIALAKIKRHEDHKIHGQHVQMVWSGADQVAIVRLTGDRGVHEIWVNVLTQKVMSSTYEPHKTSELDAAPNGDLAPLAVSIYPLYEEFEGTMLPRQKTHLRYLLPTVRYTSVDPFSPLRDRQYLNKKYDDLKAATPEGRAAGYWSMPWLQDRARNLSNAIPELPNSYTMGGVRLAGRFCQVMIHPGAVALYKDLGFTPMYSANTAFDWVTATLPDGTTDDEMKVMSSFYGKPLATAEEAAARPATRHPFHDPKTYLSEGFDELQVYYAVNTFFGELHTRGFIDPELSTRPFTAFLYNPDISMRDNAFYTNDTINFTTYSPKETNMARDNLTIWHELGHGLMDRLMDDGTGQWLHLADTGGLSEGMADFVADMILYGVKGREDFVGRNKQRIINGTGFLLTNEAHDDGEAYGGVMHDILDASVDEFGLEGVHKMTDLTMETMRFTRFHPKLTAADFFEHMLFVDSLGRPGLRDQGEFSQIIRDALARRNFEKDEASAAAFSLKYNDKEVSRGQIGARNNEVNVSLPKDGKAKFKVTMQLKDGKGFKWNYPVTLKAFKKDRGALQGAIHWTGEETAPEAITIANSDQKVEVEVEANGTCDYSNRPDGTCSDYIYFLVFDGKGTPDVPMAKKRFYVKVKTTAPAAEVVSE